MPAWLKLNKKCTNKPSGKRDLAVLWETPHEQRFTPEKSVESTPQKLPSARSPEHRPIPGGVEGNRLGKERALMEAQRGGAAAKPNKMLPSAKAMPILNRDALRARPGMPHAKVAAPLAHAKDAKRSNDQAKFITFHVTRRQDFKTPTGWTGRPPAPRCRRHRRK